MKRKVTCLFREQNFIKLKNKIIALNQLNIYLSNLEHNYRFLRGNLNSETNLIAVVKASAYGSALPAIAKRLEKLGVNIFAVAYSNEGKILRKIGIKSRIMVFYPQAYGLDNIINNKLEACLYSVNLLKEFRKKLILKKLRNFPIHIKYNTGLNRLGFNPSCCDWIINQLKDDTFALKSIYSHLAVSQAKKEMKLNKLQIESFLQLREKHLKISKIAPMFHLLNSSGLFNFPEYQFDAVRCGIALHGFANRPEWDKKLKPVAELISSISQIHIVKKGEYVGYDFGWKVSKETKIATIPLGHADGISRQLGNHKGTVSINGKIAPIVGNVCMDMFMVDVTKISCDEGDTVYVFGKENSISDLAQTVDTISYELLTAVGPRVKRVIYE